jgi:hypothetical protein
MPILGETFVIVGGQKEADYAARLWRFSPKVWDDYVDNPDPRDIQRDAEATIPLEKVKESYIISEDPQKHIKNLQTLIDGGLTHIFIHGGQDDQEKVIEFYGREVLPQIAHERMQLGERIAVGA